MVQLLYEDGFEGFLTAVFEAFALHGAATVSALDQAPPSFYETRQLSADPEKAARVRAGIARKLGQEVADTVFAAWLTHDDGIDDSIVLFLRKCFAAGQDLRANRTDDTVRRVELAAGRATHEAHMLTGFLRFQKFGRLYVADIRPDCEALPLLGPHFVDRFSTQPFVIRDHAHMQALLYDGRQSGICRFDSFEQFGLQQEDGFEKMWTAYYKAMAIAERRNPKLRRQLMPKKFWEFMPEMQEELLRRKP